MSKIVNIKEVVQRLFDKHGDNITILEYTKMKYKSHFKCNICYHDWWARTIDVTDRGDGCPECKKKKMGNWNRLSYEFVKTEIEKEGYILLSNNYINAFQKLKIICPNNHEFNISWNEWQVGHRCKYCAIEKGREQKRLPESKILEYLKEDNLQFIEFPNGYFNRNSLITYKCNKEGHLHTRSVINYKTNRGCPDCNIEQRNIKLSRDNNYNWQGGLTPLSKFIRDCLKQWKIDSMKYCNYKCVITGKKFNVIHHLYSLNTIIQDAIEILNFELKPTIGEYSEVELAELSNKVIEIHYKYPLGVCLTKEIHYLFHKLYLTGNNTPEQFNEFKSKIESGEIELDKVA